MASIYLKFFSKEVRFFLDHLNVLKKSVVEDHADLNNDKIEEIAAKVRAGLKIEDNESLITSLERFGIVGLEKSFFNKTDVSSVWIENVPYIVLGSQPKSFVRRNFDLARELGHLILHANRDINNLEKKEFDELEKQANHFASCYLLPTSDFLEDLEGIKTNISNPDAYVELKKKWKVSIAEMAYKAYNLNLMTYQQYRYFNILLNKKGYKTIEPLDLEFMIIKPIRIRKMLEFVFDKKIVDFSSFLNTFDLRVAGASHKFNIEADVFKAYQQNEAKVIDFSF